MALRETAYRVARIGGLAVLLGALPGCQNITGSVPVSQVRIINASPDAPGLDVYQAGSAMAHNLGFGTVTSYVSVAPGSPLIAAIAAGSKQQLVAAHGTLTASGAYTVLIGDVAANLSETILTDQTAAAPAGEVSVRLLDQAPQLNAGVDVYFVPSGSTVATVLPLLTNVVFGTNSGYMNLPYGTYTLVLLPTGTVPTATTVPLYTGVKASYAAGAARTLILLDRETATDPGFQVITAVDYDPVSGTN